MGSHLIEDASDAIEVQNDGPLIAVDKVGGVAVTIHVHETEIHEVIAVRILFVIDPSDYSACLSSRETKQVIYLVEEQMPSRTKHVIGLTLAGFQVVQILLGVLVPIRMGFVEDFGIRAVLVWIVVIGNDLSRFLLYLLLES